VLLCPHSLHTRAVLGRVLRAGLFAGWLAPAPGRLPLAGLGGLPRRWPGEPVPGLHPRAGLARDL